jgi:hypothetical protein
MGSFIPAELTITQLWSIFITGILVGIITLFKNEIVNFISTWISDRKLYKNRRYDTDGDPSTGQFVTVVVPATGQAIKVWLEKYTWDHFDPFKRLAVLKWPYNNEPDLYFDTAMPYAVWRTFLSGSLPSKHCIKYGEDSQYLEKE